MARKKLVEEDVAVRSQSMPCSWRCSRSPSDYRRSSTTPNSADWGRRLAAEGVPSSVSSRRMIAEAARRRPLPSSTAAKTKTTPCPVFVRYEEEFPPLVVSHLYQLQEESLVHADHRKPLPMPPLPTPAGGAHSPALEERKMKEKLRNTVLCLFDNGIDLDDDSQK